MTEEEWEECWLKYYYLWHYASISPAHRTWIKSIRGW